MSSDYSNIIKTTEQLCNLYAVEKDQNLLFHYEVKVGKLQKVEGCFNTLIARIKTEVYRRSCPYAATAEERCTELFQQILAGGKEKSFWKRLCDYFWRCERRKSDKELNPLKLKAEQLVRINIVLSISYAHLNGDANYQKLLERLPQADQLSYQEAKDFQLAAAKYHPRTQLSEELKNRIDKYKKDYEDQFSKKIVNNALVSKIAERPRLAELFAQFLALCAKSPPDTSELAILIPQLLQAAPDEMQKELKYLLFAQLPVNNNAEINSPLLNSHRLTLGLERVLCSLDQTIPAKIQSYNREQFTTRIAKLLGKERDLDPMLSALVAEIANDLDWAAEFQQLIETIEKARENNLAQMKKGNIAIYDQNNVDMLNQYTSMILSEKFAKRSEETRSKFFNLGYMLMETARITNTQIHDDSFLIDLNQSGGDSSDSRTLALHEKIEEDYQNALSTIAIDDPEREAKIKEIERRKGYQTRLKNPILEHSGWNNANWGDDGQFLRGDRVIGFMTNKGHKVEFAVSLNLCVLGYLPKAKVDRILEFIKYGNETVFRNMVANKPIWQRLEKERDALELEPEQLTALAKILSEYSFAMNRNLHVAMMTVGHGPIDGIDTQDLTYSHPVQRRT
jgi:hypothetical protein